MPDRYRHEGIVISVDDQIRSGWSDYYKAIGAGRIEEAKRIFDRVSALAFARAARRTTQRSLVSAGLLAK